MPEQILLKNKDYFLLDGLNNAHLITAFSLRASGNMSLFYGDIRESLNNRERFLAGLGINYQDLVCTKQVHGSGVRYVKEKDKGRGASNYDDCIFDTDALVTDKRRLPLAIFTADCLSIFVYDVKTPAIGLVHAGWRSTREKIIQKTIELMIKEFNTNKDDIRLSFGPAIRECCYEVGEELKNFFPQDLTQRVGKFYLDLPLINRKQILELGINEDNIFDCRLCTSCQNDALFSFRKEGQDCGRIMSVAMLKEN